MIPPAFGYVRAASAEEALEALADPEAKALAGGQSLLPLMKLRLARPTLLVDIGRLDLRGVAADGEEIRLGALTTWDELARAELLRRPPLAAIGECAAGIGDVQVRNRGTIGGGLVHADPAADMPAVVLALGARMRARSPGGERLIDADSFFSGPFTTALDQQELLLEIRVPEPPPSSGSAYVSVEHPASRFALAGAAALTTVRNGRVTSCSLAVTGLARRPLLLPVEDPERAAEAARAALDDVEVLGDRYAPAPYRRHLGTVVVRRALELALARARSEATR